jgi:hypothetical protein
MCDHIFKILFSLLVWAWPALKVPVLPQVLQAWLKGNCWPFVYPCYDHNRCNRESMVCCNPKEWRVWPAAPKVSVQLSQDVQQAG